MSYKTESFGKTPMITDVWAHNLQNELENIASVIGQGFTHIAIDTEFPGIVHRPKFVDKTIASQYALIKSNVDCLRPIQIGLSFTNDKGERPSPCSTWQFNINFDFQTDAYQIESLQLLIDAQIPFDKLPIDGISIKDLSDGFLLIGLAVNPKITWLSFHGSFDFAYFIKILTGEKLPNTVQQFNELRKHLCPSIYDIKMLIQRNDRFKKFSLARLAEGFEINIGGSLHQAGTDAFITAELFFKVKANLLGDKITRYGNKLFGLSKVFSAESVEYKSNNNCNSKAKQTKLEAIPRLDESALLKPRNKVFTGNLRGIYMNNYPISSYMNYAAFVSYANFNIENMHTNNY